MCVTPQLCPVVCQFVKSQWTPEVTSRVMLSGQKYKSKEPGESVISLAHDHCSQLPSYYSEPAAARTMHPRSYQLFLSVFVISTTVHSLTAGALLTPQIPCPVDGDERCTLSPGKFSQCREGYLTFNYCPSLTPVCSQVSGYRVRCLPEEVGVYYAEHD